MFFRRLALFLMVAVTLVGCNNEKNRNLIDQRTDQAIRMSEVAQAPMAVKSYNPLTVSNKVWAGNSSHRLRSGKPLPDRVEGARGVALIASSPMELSDIVASLSAQTGIPVRLDTKSLGTGSNEASRKKMTVAYEGSMSGLLALLAGNYGMSWHYNGSSIDLSRYITRVFTIQALPGSTSITDGIGEDSDSESSGTTAAGGGNSSTSLKQSSEMTVEMKVWEELAVTIEALLGNEGKSVVSPSSGTVTVTTTPSNMQTVATFIREENKRLSHQIAINVEIYTVTIEDKEDYEMSFSTAFEKMGDFKIGLTSGAASPVATATKASMGTLSLAILDSAGGDRIGSVFKALSSVGDTTRVAQFPLTTLNNRPVARRIGRDRTYVQSITNDGSTDSTVSTSTVTPGTIREGFSLQLTPRLLEDGRIMMQYSLSLTDIVDITSFDTGSGTIELPETSSRVFVQQTMLRSGSTLVIGGYDDEKISQSSQGTGSAYNYFLGGGSSNTKSRSMLFIAITPQVLDVMPMETF